MCLPLGSPLQKEIPEQATQKPMIFQNRIVKDSDLMHIFDLIFPEQVRLLPNIFPEQGQKISCRATSPAKERTLGSYHFLAHGGASGNGGDQVKIID